MAIAADRPGQVILLTRWHTALALWELLMGALAVALSIVGILLFAVAPEPESIKVSLALTSVGLLGGALYFGTSWYLLTHKLWLVLCADRMQCRIGQRVRWEVHYRDMAQIAIFRAWFGRIFLGVRLNAPEQFDRTWPRLARERAWWHRGWGFDLALPAWVASEPPDRILETALRCLHRFRSAAGEGAPEDASGVVQPEGDGR
jgi:hypothetical protein